MALTLPPELERRVREKVASGSFADETTVIRAALSLLDEEERKFRDLKEDLRQAEEQMERSEYIVFEEEGFLARIRGER